MKRFESSMLIGLAAVATLLLVMWVYARGPTAPAVALLAAALVSAGSIRQLARTRLPPALQDACLGFGGLVVGFVAMFLGYPLVSTSVVSAAFAAALNRTLMYRAWLRENPPVEPPHATLRLVALGEGQFALDLVNSGTEPWTAPKFTLERLDDVPLDGGAVAPAPGWAELPSALTGELVLCARALHLLPAVGVRVARITWPDALPAPVGARAWRVRARLEGTGRPVFGVAADLVPSPAS